MNHRAANPMRESVWIIGKTVANFIIGLVAGLASVFLPRMMLLLSVDAEIAPERYISLFPLEFVWLGLGFALAIGVICAILEYGTEQAPSAIFMAALGLPALLSGVLNTTSVTNKLQKAEQEKVAILRAVSDQAGIAHERVNSFEALGNSPSVPGSGRPSSALGPVFALIEPAYAQSPLSPDVRQSARFDPGIQIQRPRYVVVLKRASSQEEALRLAKELQKDLPMARAVKTEQGFIVVDSLTPRSQAEAMLDALQLKSNKKFNPSLLHIPG